MDAKPKSNKQKRLETLRKRESRARRQEEEKARAAKAAWASRAECALKGSRALRRDPLRLLDAVATGALPGAAVDRDLSSLAQLMADLKAGKLGRDPLPPDARAFRRLVELCWKKTDLLRGQETGAFANALLALSAHSRSWARRPEDWEPRTHNAYRQFHSLVRHLVAVYDVPAFMNTAWLEGLTAEGVVHQRWFLHVAQGGNLRTAAGLPVPLTKRQAHLYLQAPDDFDVISAFRWAQLIEMGGDERFVRSILATRARTAFAQDGFWLTVFRWLLYQSMLDPVHHGPIVDYLLDQRFTPSVPNPRAHLPGERLLVPPQPNLTMKGRGAETLLRAIAAWHRRLGRSARGKATCWSPSGIEPLFHEEGHGESRKMYAITELLNSRELDAEGRAMSHCVASYASSCVSGRTSIWSLRVRSASGEEARLLSLEVHNATRQIVQARRKYNALPSEKERSILGRWTVAGGPSVSKWVSR